MNNIFLDDFSCAMRQTDSKQVDPILALEVTRGIITEKIDVYFRLHINFNENPIIIHPAFQC